MPRALTAGTRVPGLRAHSQPCGKRPGAPLLLSPLLIWFKLFLPVMWCFFPSSGRMEESHFNSNPYFWPSIPTVSGQVGGGWLHCVLLSALSSEFCDWMLKQDKSYAVSPGLYSVSTQLISGSAAINHCPLVSMEQGAKGACRLDPPSKAALPFLSFQIENTMFINKMKDQLLPEKGCGLAPPHYPTLLTVPASVSLPSGISMDTESKSDQLTPHSQASVTQNITVVPVPSTGLMTAGEHLHSSPI